MMRRYLVILMMPCFVMLFGICCLAGCEGSKHHLKKVRLFINSMRGMQIILSILHSLLKEQVILL